MSTETIRLIRDGEKWEKGVWKWGKRETIYLSLHCHHQNDSCIKMGSDESHFNVSVGSDGQSRKTMSTNHNLSEEKGEPKRYRTEVLPLSQPNALPLGQTAHVAYSSTNKTKIVRIETELFSLSEEDVPHDYARALMLCCFQSY